jgi:hypothetical protein
MYFAKKEGRKNTFKVNLNGQWPPHSESKDLVFISEKREKCRYRRLQPSISTQNDIEETSISKVRTLMSTCPDIKGVSMLKNAPSISVRDIEVLILDIDVFDNFCPSILVYLFFIISGLL